MSIVDEVRQRHERHLLALPNVVGVSSETVGGRGVIVVLVGRKLPESELSPEEVIPQQIEGFPTEVVEIGEPSAPPPGLTD